MLAGGEEEAASVIAVTIKRMKTNPAWKAILAGYSCLHKYFLRTVFGKVIIRVLGCSVLQKTVQISGKHCMGNTDGRSVIGYDVFIKRQEDYHDENSERSIGAIRRLSGYASLLR